MCTHPPFRTKRKIRTHLPLGRYSSVILICERVTKRSRIEVRNPKSTPFTATQSLALNARLRFGLLETQTLMSRRKRTHQADL